MKFKFFVCLSLQNDRRPAFKREWISEWWWGKTCCQCNMAVSQLDSAIFIYFFLLLLLLLLMLKTTYCYNNTKLQCCHHKKNWKEKKISKTARGFREQFRVLMKHIIFAHFYGNLQNNVMGRIRYFFCCCLLLLFFFFFFF